MPSDWSPDGRYIAFTNTAFPMINNDQGGDVWVIDMGSNRKVTAILNTPFRESTAKFSPDGKAMAFIADDSGRPEIYVQSFEGGDTPRVTGERRLVSHNGALFLRWQRDGRAMVYLGMDNRVYSVRVSRGTRLEFGSPEPLFTIPAEARAVLPHGFGFDVSADGSRFLVPVLRSREPASLVVVQNWESLLKR
jgi:tricorn protease-like protein